MHTQTHRDRRVQLPPNRRRRRVTLLYPLGGMDHRETFARVIGHPFEIGGYALAITDEDHLELAGEFAQRLDGALDLDFRVTIRTHHVQRDAHPNTPQASSTS